MIGWEGREIGVVGRGGWYEFFVLSRGKVGMRIGMIGFEWFFEVVYVFVEDLE